MKNDKNAKFDDITLVTEIATKTNEPKYRVHRILTMFYTVLFDLLKTKNYVKIRKFGGFKVRNIHVRTKDFETGQLIVKPWKKVKFDLHSSLKHQLNNVLPKKDTSQWWRIFEKNKQTNEQKMEVPEK